MGLEDFVPSEDMASWPQWLEVSEKFKESIKKSSAGIKRVQKDEKKAQKYDIILSQFLVEMVKNPKYDFLLQDLFENLSEWYSSHFVLWILSLIYLPISDKIRELAGVPFLEFSYVKTFEVLQFDENNLHPEIKKRINDWIEDTTTLSGLDYSTLQLERNKNLYESPESYAKLLKFTQKIFSFFFQELNIKMSVTTAQNYTDFILQEIKKHLQNLKIEEI